MGKNPQRKKKISRISKDISLPGVHSFLSIFQTWDVLSHDPQTAKYTGTRTRAIYTTLVKGANLLNYFPNSLSQIRFPKIQQNYTKECPELKAEAACTTPISSPRSLESSLAFHVLNKKTSKRENEEPNHCVREKMSTIFPSPIFDSPSHHPQTQPNDEHFRGRASTASTSSTASTVSRRISALTNIVAMSNLAETATALTDAEKHAFDQDAYMEALNHDWTIDDILWRTTRIATKINEYTTQAIDNMIGDLSWILAYEKKNDPRAKRWKQITLDVEAQARICKLAEIEMNLVHIEERRMEMMLAKMRREQRKRMIFMRGWWRLRSWRKDVGDRVLMAK